MTDQEINEAVARKFAAKSGKYKGLVFHEGFWKEPTSDSLPDYCHSIEAAWEILERFDPWILQSDHGDFCFSWLEDGERKALREATAPMAICQAFLKLTEKEVA